MSYLFPRRVLRAEDVLDPIELTQDISPAAERLSGRLNAHNFKQTIASTVPIDEEAFYNTHYVKVTVDPKFGASGVFLYPKFPGDAGADVNAYRVTNTFEWQTIDNSTATPLQVVLTTGNGVLWVNTFAQYLWNGFTPEEPVKAETLEDLLKAGIWGHKYAGAFGEDVGRPCGVQFAIRLDGSVLPDTITGVDLVDFKSSLALKPVIPRTGTTFLPGPQDARGEVAASCGPPALPIRITSCIPVQAGDHTVELVVRRMPSMDDSGYNALYDVGDFVAVFNRQLAVVELKSFPVDSVAEEAVSAPAWDEEDLITQAEIYTNRVQPIINGYNEVKAGNVQRGAFMHYHLPNTLHAADTAEKQFVSVEGFNNFYPGFTSGTRTLTKDSGSPGAGWYLLSTGSSIFDIKTTQTFDPGTKGCLILVLANTQVVNVSNTSMDDLPLGLQDQFAAFRIMYKLVGDPSWYPLEESTGYVNSFVSFALAPEDGAALDLFRSAYADERAEVALMGVIDSQDLPGGAQIESIGLFGSAITLLNDYLTVPPYTRYQIRRGSILALHMRS